MRDSSPSTTTLTRVAELAGPHATVAAVRKLAGGSHARTHLIRTVAPEREVVLREFPVGDDAARREVRVLTALDGLGGLAPRLLASDLHSDWSEYPSVVISRLPGSANVRPTDAYAWAAELGRALARIQATDPARLTGFPSLFGRTAGSREALAGPAAEYVAANWDRITESPSVLTHFDFYSGNVVWDGDALTGVVDWCGGLVGPAGFDVGWCRLDLYLLYDDSVADAFLAAYELARGARLDDRLLWDLYALSRSHENVETWTENYAGVGRPDLTGARLRGRHGTWTRRLLGQT
jgi:aminoglycoside phosphotransferase (APT) family kinase protein